MKILPSEDGKGLARTAALSQGLWYFPGVLPVRLWDSDIGKRTSFPE